jgi:hypothetical protein
VNLRKDHSHDHFQSLISAWCWLYVSSRWSHHLCGRLPAFQPLLAVRSSCRFYFCQLQRWMPWLEYLRRTQRTAIRTVMCGIPRIGRPLNAFSTPRPSRGSSGSVSFLYFSASRAVAVDVYQILRFVEVTGSERIMCFRGTLNSGTLTLSSYFSSSVVM